MNDNVVIMGAGIQGICCALALSNLGIPVTLLDKTPEPLSRSGLRNEGKIHLGFIYANDPSFRTAALMLRSAIHFSPLVDSFVGRELDWALYRSRKFNYLILDDSMLSPAQILLHYTRLQEEYENTIDSSLHYLGTKPEHLFEDVNLKIPELNKDIIQQCIPTEEYALNLDAFRELLVTEIVKRDNIDFRGNHCIDSIVKTSYGYRLKGTKNVTSTWTVDAGRVVNCLWENRLNFDTQLGFAPERKWVYRLKHRILGRAPKHIAALDSFTCVLGAYGDLVNYNNHYTYLSWYPECMRGWSMDLSTPDSWEDACNGKLIENFKDEWVNKALLGLDRIFPGVADFDIVKLDGGIIFSWGKTDIDDMNSELHNRFEIGISHQDGYYSIDTGKFTSAPYFAGELQKMFV